MKRVALALFAALCVGSVWGASPTVYLEARCALSAQGVLSVSDSFTYFGQTSGRTFTTKVSYKINDGEIKTVTLNKTDTLKPASTSSSKAIWRGGDYTVNVEGFVPGDVVWVKYQLVYSGTVGGKTSQSKEYTFDTNGVVESAGSWAFSPNRFLVTGTVPVGKGVESIKIRYALNSELFSNDEATTDTLLDLDTAQVNTVQADAQGMFVFEIPFPGEHSTMVWSLWAVFDDGTEKLYTDAVEETSLLKMERKENSYVKYTWNGNGGNDAWDNPLNWTMEGLGWGIPGLVNDNIDGVYVAGTDGARSTVCFAGNAEIDLGGKTYDFYEQDDKDVKYVPYRGLEFEKPDNMEKMEVVLKNGTIGTKIPGDDNGSLLLGAKDVSLEFSNATFAIRGAKKLLVPNEGATIIFSGDYGHDWSYAPRADYSKDSKVMFKNFSGYAYYDRDLTVADGTVLEINNSIIKFRVGTANTHTAGQGFAKRVVLRDGPNSQAIMRVCYLSSGEDYYASLNLNNTYDIKIPAAGHEDANIWARNLTAEPTATFEIEVTDYLMGNRVPLINLSQTPTYKTLPTLVAKANGQDVTTARNARLFWDGKILYYQQDRQYAAEIGDDKYDTLGEALEAATAGATIKVLNDVATDAAFVITKKVTIDLNGKTIAATQADTEGNGVFWVKTGGELTLNGEGTINGVGGNAYNIAIWADGGKVIINGGTYTNEGAQDDGPDGAHFDLIYAKNGGSVEINGGTFKCQTPNWTLNKNDKTEGSFVVNGGTFYGYNPKVNNTEKPPVDWCAENTAVIETTENEVKVYTVVPAAAKISNVGYATFDAALEAAASGDTVKLLADVVVEKVVVVPTGATLDLNGKSIQALAVVGKLAMNGGALKTYDTNTQTYFFMAAPAQTAGALYWTSDAVMTIGADYTLCLDGGSVTLPNSWRSLLKQSLTIKSGATFVIPTGVELNLRGNAVVEEGATLTCDGTIALGNTYDAIDTSATLTSAQLAEGKVVSAVEGYKVQYADGMYTLVKEGYTLTITDPSVTVQTEAAANAVQLNVVPPENLTADEKAAYLGYFEKKITANAEGGYTVELALKDEFKPVIVETTPALTFEDGNVTVNIENELPGLYYGVRYATTVEAVDAAEIVPGFTVTPAEGDTAGFFKVVVDFKEIK